MTYYIIDLPVNSAVVGEFAHLASYLEFFFGRLAHQTPPDLVFAPMRDRCVQKQYIVKSVMQ